MYQKARVQQAWSKAGLDPAADPKLAAFFKHVAQAGGECWTQLVQEVRDNLPEYKERLVAPMWETGDPLLRLHLVRAADPQRSDELALLKQAVGGCDQLRDAAVLRAATATGHPEVLAAVAQRNAAAAGSVDVAENATAASQPRTAAGLARLERMFHTQNNGRSIGGG